MAPVDRQNKRPDTEKIAQAAIEEARMVLPGIQAIFGFQLMSVFNTKFADLSEFDQTLHFAAMLLIAISIALIMTPAAYHRQAEPGTFSDFFVRLASGLVAAAMLPLMIGLCLEVYIVGHVILRNALLSFVCAAALFVLFAMLWYVYPLSRAR
jgi:uncharacterized membrane protein